MNGESNYRISTGGGAFARCACVGSIHLVSLFPHNLANFSFSSFHPIPFLISFHYPFRPDHNIAVLLRPHFDEYRAWHDIELFFHRLCLRAHFFDQVSSTRPADPFTRLQYSPSTWTLPSGLLPTLDLFIENCQHDISRLNFSARLALSNLTCYELPAVRSHKSNPNIVIIPADKGDAIVVWRTDFYLAESERQLSDTSSYLPLDHDPTTEHQATVSRTVIGIISSRDLPPTASNLIVPQPRTARFYLLPKIHKQNCPGRPIVSACSCPTELISSYLDSIFSPVVQSLPTYIHDSSDALRHFDSLQFPGPNRLLFTMDIKFSTPPFPTRTV
ncbi:uncharacterized protein [Heterodontus francisci]|uniref:uncharacterized protein n=1 Tax=Heterodontus francisci TaxID=7792 RepID=UPI00355AFAA1